MSADLDHPSKPDASRFSMAWDVVIPIIVAAIPVGAFRLLGLVARDLDKPGATAGNAAIAAIVVLQAIGIIAMAFVMLVRFETACIQLRARADRQPAAWRRVALVTSIACLLLTDILANVAALPGAGFLLIAAVPAFLAYLACKAIAFAGLSGGREYDE